MTEDLHRTAIHEAGHVVCAFLLGLEVEGVTIKPNGASAGVCEATFYRHPRRKYKHALRMAQLYSAGYSAECLALEGEADVCGAASDFREMRACFHEAGLSDLQATRCRMQASRKVTRLLAHPPHMRAVETLAEALLQKETLSWREAMNVTANAMLGC